MLFSVYELVFRRLHFVIEVKVLQNNTVKNLATLLGMLALCCDSRSHERLPKNHSKEHDSKTGGHHKQ